MTNQEIVLNVYKKVTPLIQKINNMEDTDQLEFELDFLLQGITEEQEEMLDEMLEENGII